MPEWQEYEPIRRLTTFLFYFVFRKEFLKLYAALNFSNLNAYFNF